MQAALRQLGAEPGGRGPSQNRARAPELRQI